MPARRAPGMLFSDKQMAEWEDARLGSGKEPGMRSNSMRHQDMISFVAGNGGMTGQMISRGAWQRVANVAISNLRLLQEVG
jgi:hypothetical protein